MARAWRHVLFGAPRPARDTRARLARFDRATPLKPMKQFEFSTLRIFVFVARTGSLSAAAEQLHLAVAAISKRIVDLEASVGTRLFLRHGRGGVALTPAGQTLLQHAHELLLGVERMHAEVSEFARGVEGQVRIAATSSAVTQYLPQELKTFASSHPRIRVDLREMFSHHCVEALHYGLADIAVVATEQDLDRLEVFPYHEDQLCLMVPAAHPAARLKRISFERALQWDIVGVSATSALMTLLGGHAGGRMRLRAQVMSFAAVSALVHAGFGLGVAPEKEARRQGKLFDLRIVPLSDDWANRPMVLAVRSRHTLTVSARELLEALMAKSATS